MRRFLYGLGNAFLTVLLILIIIYGWAFVDLKIMLKPYPDIFGYTFYMIKDDTMAPDFYTNDIAIIDNKANYGVGDKILFLSKDSKYYIHTIVSTDSMATTTKCNTCAKSDAPIDSSQIIGKAVAKISYAGVVVNFFKKKSVLAALAIFGVGCLIVSQSFKYKPKVKKIDENDKMSEKTPTEPKPHDDEKSENQTEEVKQEENNTETKTP